MTVESVAKALDEALEGLMRDEAPLAVRLERYAVILREINQPFAEAVDRLVARLNSVEAGNDAPRIAEVFPPFQLPDESSHFVALDDLLAKGPVVVAFRRGHWCPYCQLATDALARIQADIVSLGGSIVAISPERSTYARKLRLATRADFPILTDIDNGYAMSLGLAISVGEEMREFMTRRGRDLATYQGSEAWLLPIPATFVLDRNGIIVMRHVDPDYRHRAATDEILASLRVLRTADGRT